MNQKRKTLLRAAVSLREQYIARWHERRSRWVPDVKAEVRPFSQRMLRQERLFRMALGRGSELATEILRHRYIRALEDVRSVIDSQYRQFGQRDTPAPSPRDLFEELVAAEQEFGRIEFNARKQRISVTTEPIQLEGIHLGRFRIDLFLDCIERKDPLLWFRVEAMDPNPAASNADVTHPHVNDCQLCAGDAIHPIEHALQDGRISEFFALVRSVLTNYNAESPYVALSEWEGHACHDCGYTTNDECAYYCEGCEEIFCDECIRSCEICGTTLCRECMHQSEISDAWACESCAAQCNGCSLWCTTDELTNGLCEHCLDQQDHEETTHETDSDTEDDSRETTSAAAGE